MVCEMFEAILSESRVFFTLAPRLADDRLGAQICSGRGSSTCTRRTWRCAATASDHGVLSLGMGWQVPRLPGLGEVAGPLHERPHAVGYDYVVIEHEDRQFEARRSGQGG